MVEIPAEVRIRSTLRCGSVFYFREDTFSSGEPHYFVVLNRDPAADERLVLLSATSQIDKARARNRDPVTLVIVAKEQYSDLKVDSAFEGDSAMVRTVGQLADKVNRGEVVRLHNYMPPGLIKLLQTAVLASRVISGEVKRLIDPGWVLPS